MRAAVPTDESCGSPAQVKSRFLRFLDLDNRVLVDKNNKRGITQWRPKTVLVRTILCLLFSSVNLSNRVAGKLGTELSSRREPSRRVFWSQQQQRSVSQF